jgi:hypothetical protein
MQKSVTGFGQSVDRQLWSGPLQSGVQEIVGWYCVSQGNSSEHPGRQTNEPGH